MSIFAEDHTIRLHELIQSELSESELFWLQDSLDRITASGDTAKLYLTYSQLSSNIEKKQLALDLDPDEVSAYLGRQNADTLELSRIYLLARVLDQDFDFFVQKVAKIIQVADQSELITFLKYLILLPQSEAFTLTAVESLRTNITPVFEAISMKNPYPATYFNDQQWNQMYLKAAFMQLNLNKIVGVEERANADLTRIISDYAHERWAASRNIDPMIWRPVSGFMNEAILADMKHLLSSDDEKENWAGALCCYESGQPEAMNLLEARPELLKRIEEKKLDWNDINI